MKNKVVFTFELDPNNEDQRKALGALMDTLTDGENVTVQGKAPVKKEDEKTATSSKTNSTAPAKTKLTLAEIQAAIKEKQGKHKDAIVKKLKDLGAAKSADLAEAKYDEFHKWVTGLGAAPASSGTTLTLEEIRAEVAEKSGDHLEELNAKLKELGVKKVSLLTEDKFEEFNAFLKTLK